MAYTKDRLVEKIPAISGQDTFTGKYQAFRSTLFPAPPLALEPSWNSYRPSLWKWSSLTQSELKDAYLAEMGGRTLGLDRIT